MYSVRLWLKQRGAKLANETYKTTYLRQLNSSFIIIEQMNYKLSVCGHFYVSKNKMKSLFKSVLALKMTETFHPFF